MSVVQGHDGLALECWRGSTGPVFEIFRNAESMRFGVTLFEQDVPLELLEFAVPFARVQLVDFDPLYRLTSTGEGVTGVLNLCRAYIGRYLTYRQRGQIFLLEAKKGEIWSRKTAL